VAKFSEMLDSYSDEELGAKMRDRFTRLADAHTRGLTDTHPSEVWNADNATLRAHRAAHDNELAQADPSTPAKGGPSASSLEAAAAYRRPANDSALKRHESNVRQSERDTEVETLIPNYGRLP